MRAMFANMLTGTIAAATVTATAVDA